MISYIERWLSRIVNQAIVDAMNYKPDPAEDTARQNNLFVAGATLWLILVAVATYVAVFGGAN